MKNTSFQFLLIFCVFSDWKCFIQALHKIFDGLQFDAAKKEMERIEKYLLENRAVVDTYNDSTVRSLISSIEVTPELDLKIYIKGGYEITEKYLPLKKSA